MSAIILGKAQLEAWRCASDDVVCRPQLAGVLVERDGSVTATDGCVLVHVGPVCAAAADYPVPDGWNAP